MYLSEVGSSSRLSEILREIDYLEAQPERSFSMEVQLEYLRGVAEDRAGQEEPFRPPPPG